MKRVISLLFGVGVLVGCSPQPPTEEDIARLWPRPEDVPASAVLQAGLDGGHWSDCEFQGDRLRCDIYKVRGGLAFSQSYKVCMEDNPGTLAGGVMGIDGRGLSTGWDNIVLVPVGPQELPPGDQHLQDKAQREFEELSPLECSIQLVPRSPE